MPKQTIPLSTALFSYFCQNCKKSAVSMSYSQLLEFKDKHNKCNRNL